MTVSFRTGERSDRALAGLTADGSRVSDAIRQSLVNAVRLRRRERMRRESLDPGVRGNEQRGSRFPVVAQSEDLLLSTVRVAPTSRSEPPGRFDSRVERTRCAR